MSDSACPMPREPRADEQDAIDRMLAAHRIAVVGLSDDQTRPSYQVSEYLQAQGYQITPVNPAHARVLGRKCYRLLSEMPEPPEVVLVFRRSEYCAAVAEQAVDAGAKGIWLQSGIRNEEARRLAEADGLDFVQDRCMMVEHMRRQRPAGC